MSDLNLLDNAPTAFFGHSLGGLIAFELIRSLEQDKYFGVSNLILSAVKDPIYVTLLNSDASNIKHHLQNDNDLLDYIQSIGGLPTGVHPDFLRMALPALRDDYKVFETYQLTDSCAQLSISSPITAMGMS